MGGSCVSFWIVDDDQSFGKSLKRMLTAMGIQAEHFGSAQSFLDAVLPGQSGCAIVDVHMPFCDGFCLMRKMRELSYAMSVIVITGQPDSHTGEQALECGALGYLSKPFTVESLLELVRDPDAKKAGSQT
jgi:two-component system, LuxR family, response regulator FixJ